MKERAWKEAQTFSPDIAIIKLGTNDSKNINWDTYAKEFSRDYQQMIDALRALPSKPRILLCTPIASMKTAVSEKWLIRDSIVTEAIIPAIQKIAKKNKLQLLDLHPVVNMDKKDMQADGIHPTSQGAKKIAEKVKEAILKEQ